MEQLIGGSTDSPPTQEDKDFYHYEVPLFLLLLEHNMKPDFLPALTEQEQQTTTERWFKTF